MIQDTLQAKGFCLLIFHPTAMGDLVEKLGDIMVVSKSICLSISHANILAQVSAQRETCLTQGLCYSLISLRTPYI